MSVLYKALQKAEKENEQRQGARTGIDPDRLAESGAIRGSRGRRVNWRIAGLLISGVFIVVMGAAYYLVSTGALSPPQQQVALAPPPATQQPAPPQNAEPQTPAAQVPVVTQPAPGAPTVAAAAPADTTPAPANASPPEPEAPVAAASEQPGEAEPATEAKVASAPAAVPAPKPPGRQPMPQIAADSPARMLSPPIAVKREDYAFAGVGDVIQVREVSAQAQSDVRSGYAALINGQYDTALGFYERASKNEPSSVLALLGRGTAYQKLGRDAEARAAYEGALKIDPKNREALTNLTGLTAQSRPEEALKSLVDLEVQHKYFSPIAAQIGLTYAKMGNSDAAIEHLRRAIALTPDAPMYHYNLAVVFDRAGQREQAVASYKEVLGLTDSRNVTGLSRVDIQRRVEFLSVQH